MKAKLTQKDGIVGNLEDLIELIKQAQTKKKKPNFVDTLPIDSDGEFILSEDDDDTSPAQYDGKAFKKQKVGPIHHPLYICNRQKKKIVETI